MRLIVACAISSPALAQPAEPPPKFEAALRVGYGFGADGSGPAFEAEVGGRSTLASLVVFGRFSQFSEDTRDLQFFTDPGMSDLCIHDRDRRYDIGSRARFLVGHALFGFGVAAEIVHHTEMASNCSDGSAFSSNYHVTTLALLELNAGYAFDIANHAVQLVVSASGSGSTGDHAAFATVGFGFRY